MAEKLPRIPEPSSHKKLHPIAQKIFDHDLQKARLREHSFLNPPKYQDADGKRLLEAFNGVLWAFHRLGFKPTVTGRVNFRTHITFAERGKSFVLFLLDAHEGRGAKPAKNVAAPHICFAWESEEWDAKHKRDYRRYDRFSADAIRALVLGLVAERERDYREWVASSYEWSVSRRKDLIEEIEAEHQIGGSIFCRGGGPACVLGLHYVPSILRSAGYRSRNSSADRLSSREISHCLRSLSATGSSERNTGSLRKSVPTGTPK